MGIEAAGAAAASEPAALDTAIAENEQLALALSDRLGRREITLDRYDAAVRPLDRQIAELRARREALGDPQAPPADAGAGRVVWQERWDAADPSERRTLLRMALRGRVLPVGPADPHDRTAVEPRLSIGDP
jgi:hypothetical protein